MPSQAIQLVKRSSRQLRVLFTVPWEEPVGSARGRSVNARWVDRLSRGHDLSNPITEAHDDR